MAECVRGRSKRGGATVLAAGCVSLLAGASALAADVNALPTGGSIAQGNGHIAVNGGQMTIIQQTDRMVANWASYNIGQNAGVTYLQPSTGSIAVNRVAAGAPSEILGSLKANGQVWLINPSGIVFGQNSQVNVGGLVASSLQLTDDDFLAGRYRFAANGSAGSVVNHGQINGKVVALIAPSVTNTGTITADGGGVMLGAGNQVTLDFSGDGLIGMTVDKGAVDALAENSGRIQADGGAVILSARSADALTQSVVNNTGIVRARTLANKGGRILLLADMKTGVAEVDGTLDASAPTHGNGGFIETSAAQVQVADAAVVTTRAENGRTGTWLIDPTDFTISAGSGPQTGSGIGASTLQAALVTNNVTLATGSAGAEPGDIHVNAEVSWHAHTLTLSAHGNININAPLNATDFAGLALEYGQGAVAAGNTATYRVNAPVNLASTATFSTKLGSDGPTHGYTIITRVGFAGSTNSRDLDAMRRNLSGRYVLGADIDASGTRSWNGFAGFTPIGGFGNPFDGTFDGLGHTINGLTINHSSGRDYVGLFGIAGSGSSVRNVGMVGGGISGDYFVGGLVGINQGSISHAYSTADVAGTGYQLGGLVGSNQGTITSAYATGAVLGERQMDGTGSNDVGGLVGINSGTISHSYATGIAAGGHRVGGLAGSSSGTISNSYATASVGGGVSVGGLVGSNVGGAISDSRATGPVNVMLGSGGGLVGYNESGTISRSHATGAVNGDGASFLGGLVGYNFSGNISAAYATGNVDGYANSSTLGAEYVGGLVGYHGDGTLTNVYATGNVNAGTSAGGLVGQNTAIISHAYATGNVTSTRNQNSGGFGQEAGGLVGWNMGRIRHAYSSGQVTSSHAVGGLVGVNSSNIGVSHSYWNVTTSGRTNGVGGGWAAGTGLTSAQMQQQASFAGFSFSDSNSGWFIYEGRTAPLLNAFLTPLTITADTQTQTYNGAASTLGLSNAVYSVAGADTSGAVLGIDAPYAHAVNAGTYAPQLWSHQQGYRITVNGGALEIARKNLTITGAAVHDKIYDGTTSATVAATGNLSGLVGSETLALDATNVSAAFADKNTGTAKTVTIQGYVLGNGSNGGLASNYVLNPATTTADITPKTVTLTGASVHDKTYDGTTTAALAAAGNLSGLVGSETLALDVSNVSAAFADKNAGTAKTVTIQGYALGNGSNGGLASNYVLDTSAVTDTADITPKSLGIIGAIAHDKTYDGTTSATLAPTGNLSGLAGSETLALDASNVSAAFADKNAGTAKTVTIQGYVLGNGSNGGLASNYVLNPATTTADISPKAVTVTGASVYDKTYDGTTSATVAAAGNLSGLVGSETLTLDVSNVSAAFADKNAGTAKTVTIQGYVLGNGSNGGLANNYVLNASAVTDTADITPKALTVTARDLVGPFSGQPHQGGNGVAYSGFVPGEDASVLNGLLTYGGSSQGAVQNGHYLITPGGLSSGNYALHFVDGILTIRPGASSETAPVVSSVLRQACGDAPGQCDTRAASASRAVEQLVADPAPDMAVTGGSDNLISPAKCLKDRKLRSDDSCI